MDKEYTTEKIGTDNTDFRKDKTITRLELISHLEKMGGQMESILSSLVVITALLDKSKKKK